jgi:hypothetical protein
VTRSPAEQIPRRTLGAEFLPNGGCPLGGRFVGFSGEPGRQVAEGSERGQMCEELVSDRDVAAVS